jgi:hypothetical protein
MVSIDYLGKRYHRFIGDMALHSSDEPNILIALNGASRSNLNAVSGDISRATKKAVHVTSDIIDTESSLSRIFTEAHNSREVLLFDEADSLFGKRSEVKDSHDRYANIEVANLLKSIENHDGIVILASGKRKTPNSSLSSKVNILIQFPPFLTFFRKVIMNLTSHSSTPLRGRTR